MDHYSWLVALLWRFELFTSSRRHHHQNRSTGDQGTPFYLSKWSNVRWHPINLVETSGFYTEKTPKNMDRTNEANRFLAGWPAVNSLSQRGKLGSVLWNPSCALAPDMDHEIAQMSETWSNWLLRACSSICRCLQIWNWTWQHRPKPSIGNTAPAACNHGIPSNKFPPKDWRGSEFGSLRVSTGFHDIERASPTFSWGRHQNIPQLLAPLCIWIFRLRSFAEVPPAQWPVAWTIGHPNWSRKIGVTGKCQTLGSSFATSGHPRTSSRACATVWVATCRTWQWLTAYKASRHQHNMLMLNSSIGLGYIMILSAQAEPQQAFWKGAYL